MLYNRIIVQLSLFLSLLTVLLVFTHRLLGLGVVYSHSCTAHSRAISLMRMVFSHFLVHSCRTLAYVVDAYCCIVINRLFSFGVIVSEI